MQSSLRFGRILGIPIGAHSSWLLIAGLVTISLARGYFPREYPGWGPETYWVVAAITAALFFASVLIHELGHSIVARREGLPVHGITLFVFGGIAQIGREPSSAFSELRIAIAGPLTSLALAGAFRVLGLLEIVHPVLGAPGIYLSRINALLALFNLIPGFPLDGGRVLRAMLWHLGRDFRQATFWAASVGRGVALLLIGWGVVRTLSGDLGGLWIAFIGWFLENAAESSYQHVAVRDLLSGVRVRDLMTSECPTVPGALPLERFVDEHVLRAGRRCVVVTNGTDLLGLVTLHNIKTVQREEWASRTVADIMTPIEGLQRVHPNDNVLTVLQRMDEADVHQVPVTDNGQLVGLFTREHLIRYIRARTELGV